MFLINGIAVAIFLISSSAGALNGFVLKPEKLDVPINDSLEFLYYFQEPILTHEKLGTYISINETEPYGNPGEPVLPIKTIKILLPADKQVKNIKVTPRNGYLLPGTYKIAPGQYVYPLSFSGEIRPTEPDPQIYDSYNMFPGHCYKSVSTQQLCGYTILIMNIYPIQYIPKAGELYFYPELKVTIDLCQNSGTSNTLLCRSLPQDIARVKNMVENPNMITSYASEKGRRETIGEKGALVDSTDTYTYVVITNEALRDSTGEYTFQDLVASKIAKGISATIVTVEDIKACSDYWWDGLYGDGDPIFNDTACQIRNFIKDAYENWETEYILLGGDGDGADVGGESGDNIIPARLLYATIGIPPLPFNISDLVASDVYYAGLNGMWNNPENPFPTNKDLSIADPGVNGSGGGFLDNPTIDSNDFIVGSDAMLWNCTNASTGGWRTGRCNLTIDPPYLDISEKKWLHFDVKATGNITQLGNVILRSSNGKRMAFYQCGIDPAWSMWSLHKNTWSTEHIFLDYLGSVEEGFNWHEVDSISIEVRACYSLTLEDTVRIDGLYFSDFCDAYWGEPGEDDLLAEVFVGRAPVDNDIELSNFVRKTLAYETTDDPYLQDVWMVGEHLGFGGSAEWGGNFKDEIKNGCSRYGYVTEGFPPEYDVNTLYDRDWQEHGWPQPDHGTGGWPKSEITNIINNGVHIINHLGHGNNYHVMKLDEPVFMRSGDISGPCHDIINLTNEDYFFMYSQACLAGSFDNAYPLGFDYGLTEDLVYLENDSIVEYMVTAEHGAFACIANTRYGLGYSSTDAPSQRFDREFWDAVFGEDIRNLGKANQDSKEDTIGQIDRYGIRYCYYTVTLFGDPELSIKKYPPVICGDANNDGTINVADVVYLINYLFIGGPAPVPDLCVGDANGDSMVDISDVVYLTNYLFVGGPNPGGCCIPIPPPLEADAHGPYVGNTCDPMYFTGTATGGCPPYIQWQWDFGDGTNSIEKNSSHVYILPGEYLATLIVTDSQGNTDNNTASVTIKVMDANAHGLYAGVVNEPVQFIGSVCGGTPLYTWLWNFGDGDTSTLQTPVHTYDTEGKYIVTLTIIDSNGVTDSDTTLAIIGLYLMLVDNTSGTAGETGHVICINGTWNDTLSAYTLGMYFDETKIEIIDVILQDTVVDFPGQGDWHIMTWGATSGYLQALAIFDFSHPVYLPPGSGTLFKVVVSIKEDASNGPTALDLAAQGCYFINKSAFSIYPNLVDGVLTISGGNNLPTAPGNPNPANHATDVSVNAVLSWTASGDPDPGDTVTYDVYFGTTTPPTTKVSSNQSVTTYDPGTMNYDTKYYWQIIAWDNHNASNSSLIWDFTTASPVTCTLEQPVHHQKSVPTRATPRMIQEH
jgi:PKD repeat protein